MAQAAAVKTKPAPAQVARQAPVFKWSGKTRTGDVRSGEMEAQDAASVEARLRQMGIEPTKVRKKPKESEGPCVVVQLIILRGQPVAAAGQGHGVCAGEDEAVGEDIFGNAAADQQQRIAPDGLGPSTGASRSPEEGGGKEKPQTGPRPYSRRFVIR